MVHSNVPDKANKIMYKITVETVGQANNVKDFLQDRAQLSINKDFTICIGNVVNFPENLPYKEQIKWKFFD